MFSKQTCKCWVWPTPTFTRGLLLILRAGKILFFPFSVGLQRLGMGWGEKGRTSHLAPWAFLLFSLSVLSNSLWSDGLQQTRLSFTISLSLLKLASIESVMPSNHFVLCRPLLLLPSIFFSIRVFSNELALPFWWPKYWRFSFSIRPSSEYSGLISLPGMWGEKQIWYGALDLDMPVYLVFLWNVLCSWAAEAGLQAEIVSPLYTLEAWMWKYPHAGGRVVR